MTYPEAPLPCHKTPDGPGPGDTTPRWQPARAGQPWPVLALDRYALEESRRVLARSGQPS